MPGVFVALLRCFALLLITLLRSGGVHCRWLRWLRVALRCYVVTLFQFVVVFNVVTHLLLLLVVVLPLRALLRVGTLLWVLPHVVRGYVVGVDWFFPILLIIHSICRFTFVYDCAGDCCTHLRCCVVALLVIVTLLINCCCYVTLPCCRCCCYGVVDCCYCLLLMVLGKHYDLLHFAVVTVVMGGTLITLFLTVFVTHFSWIPHVTPVARRALVPVCQHTDSRHWFAPLPFAVTLPVNLPDCYTPLLRGCGRTLLPGWSARFTRWVRYRFSVAVRWLVIITFHCAPLR